jgi:hypothetical protein
MSKNFFSGWAREARDRSLGRIRIYSGRWLFAEDAPKSKLSADLRENHPSADADGRDMLIIGQRAVFCRHRKWQGTYPRIVNGANTDAPGKFAVPYTACRKCQFYAKSDKRIRFPRCLYVASAHTLQEAEIVGAKSVVDGIAAAADMMNKWFK